jgi:sulfate adenylyltransferase
MMDHLNLPHCGQLVNVMATPERAADLGKTWRHWPSWDLTPRQLCDVELLLDGSFSPLQSFMSRSEYESIVANMRLKNGLLWPIPVVLDVTDEFAQSIGSGASIALRDPEGVMVAALHVEELWKPDRMAEVESV